MAPFSDQLGSASSVARLPGGRRSACSHRVGALLGGATVGSRRAVVAAPSAAARALLCACGALPLLASLVEEAWEPPTPRARGGRGAARFRARGLANHRLEWQGIESRIDAMRSHPLVRAAVDLLRACEVSGTACYVATHHSRSRWRPPHRLHRATMAFIGGEARLVKTVNPHGQLRQGRVGETVGCDRVPNVACASLVTLTERPVPAKATACCVVRPRICEWLH